MKLKASLLILTMLAIVAANTVNAQNQQTRSVSDFHSISAAGPFNVYVKIDGTESLKISAESEIIDKIETVVEEGNLKIKFKNHNNWDYENVGKIDIWVTAKSLSALKNAGSGNIKVEGELNGDKVSLSLSGSGDITSKVNSGKLKIALSGSGSFHIDGKSDDTNISIAGSGEFKGREFKSNTSTISIAGSGSVYIAAEKEISASIVGSGNVIYSGNASVDARTIGSGRVSKSE